MEKMGFLLHLNWTNNSLLGIEWGIKKINSDTDKILTF